LFSHTAQIAQYRHSRTGALCTARNCGTDCAPCFYCYFYVPHGPYRNL